MALDNIMAGSKNQFMASVRTIMADAYEKSIGLIMQLESAKKPSEPIIAEALGLYKEITRRRRGRKYIGLTDANEKEFMRHRIVACIHECNVYRTIGNLEKAKELSFGIRRAAQKTKYKETIVSAEDMHLMVLSADACKRYGAGQHAESLRQFQEIADSYNNLRVGEAKAATSTKAFFNMATNYLNIMRTSQESMDRSIVEYFLNALKESTRGLNAIKNPREKRALRAGIDFSKGELCRLSGMHHGSSKSYNTALKHYNRALGASMDAKYESQEMMIRTMIAYCNSTLSTTSTKDACTHFIKVEEYLKRGSLGPCSCVQEPLICDLRFRLLSRIIDEYPLDKRV